MNNKVVRALIVGGCFGVLGYLIMRDFTASLFLGGVWFLAMMIGKKKD